MFRILDIPLSGQPEVSEELVRLAPPPEATIRWVDFEGPGHEQLSLLADRFGFHPLSIEDSSHFDQRPKLEDFEDYLFIVTHGFELAPTESWELHSRELHAFLGRGYLVTIHSEPIPRLDAVFVRAFSDPGSGRRGADFLFYLVLDAIVDGNLPLLDRIEERIEEIEATVLTTDRDEKEQLQRIFDLKRLLVSMRRTLASERDVLAALARGSFALIDERNTPYFRDVSDHLVRSHEELESARDLLGNALDAYLSMSSNRIAQASNRTNETMKRLTAMNAIFLPLTFLTGFFGQNFVHLPFSSSVLMWAMIAACALIPGGMLLWFRTRRLL